MKKLFLFAITLFLAANAGAQARKAGSMKIPAASDLPQLTTCILQAQENTPLFIANLDSNSWQNDVNSIIKDIELYIDSLRGNNSKADVLLVRNFAPLRQFFLTTTNKTSVATSFIYADLPYRFCLHNDSSALFIGAIKCGEMYNLTKITERRAIKQALTNCLLPALKPFVEFRNTGINYVALSVYYGCRDSREGAPSTTAYCLTLVARLADVQDYSSGLITAKGLLSSATLFHCGTEDKSTLNKIQINVD